MSSTSPMGALPQMYLLLLLLLMGPMQFSLVVSAGCSAGFYWNRNLAQCAPCSEGTYQPNANQDYCYECLTGTYQTRVQSTTCDVCPENQSTFSSEQYTILISGATACAFCPAGRSLTASGCGGCPTGFYCNGQSGPLPCATPRPFPTQEYILSNETCTATRNAVIRTCTTCRPAPDNASTYYTREPCTSSTDAVCALCTVCPAMQAYQVSACNSTADTVCKPCDHQAGDTRVGGKCNPCPPGAYGADCAPCPAGTFSSTPDAAVCQACPSGKTSGAGASWCVTKGCCAPDGVQCEFLSAAASRLAAYDASSNDLQAVAPTARPGQFMVAVTPAQLYVLGNGSSWLFAGAFQPAFEPIDGTGMLAVLHPSVLQLCLDPISQGYLLLESTGVLRWISAHAEVRTVTLVGNDVRVSRIASSNAPYTFWVILSATGRLMRLNVMDGTLSSPFSSGSSYSAQLPLSLFASSSANEPEGVASEALISVYVLDVGLLLRFSTPDQATPQIVCGGGEQLFTPLSKTTACSVVSLVKSGVFDAMEYQQSIYLLFYSQEWGIGVSKLVDNQLSKMLLHLPNEGNGMMPLQLVAGPDALYLAFRNPPQVLQIALDGHCPCQPGLYSGVNGTLCLPSPLGRIAPLAWTSTPVACPLGSISVSTEQCAPCPSNYTTARSGSWYCRSICEPNQFMNPDTGACMPECNASLGLYRHLRLGQCLPCWLGSGASGDVCIPCPPGEYGLLPGVCAACPAGTTTVSAAATRCMPLVASYCQDGGWTCPPAPNVPSVLLAQNVAATSSLLVWPNGSYVLGDASDTLLLTYYTVPTPTVVWTRSSYTNGTLHLGDLAVSLQLVPGQSMTLYHAAVFQVFGYVPVVYVSTMLSLEEGTPACAEVYAVSAFDRSVTRFMSQDILKNPTILLSQCILQPIVLHVSRSGVLYAAVGARLYSTRLIAGSTPQDLFKNQLIMLQVDQGVITHLATVGDTEATEHLFVGTSAGQIHSVPHSATEAQPGYPSLYVNVGGFKGMGAAGRRVLFLTHTGSLMEVVFNNVQGCMAGYIATQLHTVWAGLCMQAGRGTAWGAACPPGTYGPTPASLHCEQCPAGSIAPLESSPVCTVCEDDEATLSSADGTQCLKRCPSTQEARVNERRCVACAPGYAFSNKAGACAPCPAGTYAPSAGSMACLACASGHTSPPGAHSCVRVCGSNAQCAYDGEQCASLTKNYQVLSQVVISSGGRQLLTLAVDMDGGVFYSDGTRLQYYQDTCASYDTQCSSTGVDLLPPGQYDDYRFISLAICNRIQYASPAEPLSCPTRAYRRLYLGSLTRSSVYSLKLCLNDNQHNAAGGVEGHSVNATATSLLAGTSGFSLVAGRSWPGFADGPFAEAAFNQPVDLELNGACDLLYVSDFGNHRIRQLNFSSRHVSTLVGSGQACWKEGHTNNGAACSDPVAMGCDPSFPQCPSVQYPLGIGLSEDESHLYLAGNVVNSLFAFRFATKQLTNICGFAYNNMQFGTVQTCDLSELSSKGCMLHRPFDVAAFQGQLFVGVTQGITRIDETTRRCEQVAGRFFDLRTYGLFDGVMPVPDLDLPTTSLVNMPFKMAVSKGTGVLYFADLLNGAVRRVLVKTVCQCPAGTLLVGSANACYNPSPSAGELKPLLECPNGLYALPGDWGCFRSCAEALAGLSYVPAQCMVLPTSPLQSVTYAQLLSRLSPPQNTLSADWYGEVGAFDSGGLFPLTATFRQGAVAGRAPSSLGDFVALTFDPSRQCWSDAEAFASYALRPHLILPGLWFACGTSLLDASNPDVRCACPTNVVGFERTPITPEEEAAAAARPKRWQALRNAAVAGGSPDLNQSSVFIMLGTADQGAPATCPGRGEGPCFPIFQLQSKDVPVENRKTASTWVKDRVLRIQCRIGWPAHYYCPNGYVWMPPALTTACSGVKVMATCRSCLPGTFSNASLQVRQVQGGPYRCRSCEAGFYASGVGSAECLACPVGTYSSAPGSTRCTACSPGKYTLWPNASMAEHCADCVQGTGNCTACLPGQYQHLQGQLRCRLTPAGFYSPETNATAPTPCPPGTYQPYQGRTHCFVCELGTVTAGEGASACTPCPSANQTTACPLSLGNRCGAGCGLNRYYNYPSSQCLTCAPGTLNAQNPCATDPNVCWESPRRDFYLDPVQLTIAQCPPGTQASDKKDGCVQCAAGKYSDLASGGCVECRAGTYAERPQSTTCLLCAPGFSNSQAGFLACSTPCTPGTYAPANGSAACWPCDAGFIAPLFQSTACQACAIDTVAPAPGMDECNVTCDTAMGFYSGLGDTACRYCSNGLALNDTCRTCGKGHYFYVNGSVRVCERCPAGLVNLFNTSATDIGQCVPCPSPTAYALLNAFQCVETDEGFVPNRSLTGPVACPPGTFRNASQTQCTPCAPGTAASGSGSRQCAPCAVGFFGATPGLEKCVQCASGTISNNISLSQSLVGATGCTACPPGTYAFGSQTCLPCPVNTFSLGRTTTCLPCAEPLYSPGGASRCSMCPEWTTWSSAERSCAVCSPGTFMAPSSPGYECLPCNQGTFLPFRGSRSFQNCTQCPLGTIATGTGASVCTNCSQPGTTARADGISCAKCLPGTYNQDGGACVPCARGTFVTYQGATVCQVCAPGTFQNVTMGGTTCLLCPPGTISDGSTGKECLSCNRWPGTFASGAGQTLCTRRKSVCKPLEYYNVSYDPTQDNTCVPCVPCAQDQLVIAYDSSADKLRPLTPNVSIMYQNQLCPGTMDAPLYRCLSMAPVAGQYITLSESVGTAVGSSTYDPYTLHTCEDPQFDSAMVAWVPGLDIQGCYVSCLYGINPQAVRDIYTSILLAPPRFEERPEDNLFLQRMLPWKASICLPCPKSACPRGLYRPDYTGQGVCGPPCGLPNSVCQNLDSTGCIAACTNRPANADYVGGGVVLGQNACPWQCLLGWYLSDNRTACLPCATASSGRSICNSSDYAVVQADQCLPWHTSRELCKYCPPTPFARLVGWNSTSASCQYACISGYYANNTLSGNATTCTPCHHVWLYNWTVCPVGMYLDEAQCHASGVRPDCKPCNGSTTAAAFVSAGVLNAPASCKASCAPGFHTVARSTGTYADYADLSTFPPLSDLQCVQCLPEDQRSCNFTHACFAGYFRNMSVRNGQNNSCVPCKRSRQCPAGTYAPLCTGDALVDAQCLPCAQSLLVHQRFVPYSTQGRIVSPDHCPRVCLNNHVQKQLSPMECTPCASGAPCPSPGVQPPACAFVYAYWNATPALAWWDAQHAPPHIPYSATRPVERAGVCWACPLGTATLPESTGLCVPLPGFSLASTPLPNAKLPIPSLPSDIYLVMQAPRVPALVQRDPLNGNNNNLNNRRLYQIQADRNQSVSTAMMVATAPVLMSREIAVPCPYGTYKASAGDAVCNVCPEGSSTMRTGSISLSACMCKYGFYLAARTRGPCLPCPRDTFSNVSVSVLDKGSACTRCPPNTSTLGATGATTCACALGFVRVNGVCVRCRAGFYCPPCTETDAECVPSDQRACFVGATSPPGSYGIANCTCGPGLVRATLPKSNLLYCRTLPLGFTVTPDGQQLTCLPGWKRSRSGDACTLCPPGTYAALSSDGVTPLLRVTDGTPLCQPCPANTYNPTASALGACTPCPSQQVASNGSVRLSDCACPPPTLPVPGGCKGCLANQFAESVGQRCRSCPSNSLAQAGASSIKDCLCMPGYALQAQTNACEPCPIGFYSTHASNTPCAPCPKGSTTAGPGSTRLSACGETAALCLPGYTWRLGVGCFLV